MKEHFCSAYLTDEDYQDLREGKIVFCPKCHHQVALRVGNLVISDRKVIGKIIASISANED